jgi:FkbM family methyltransferase
MRLRHHLAELDAYRKDALGFRDFARVLRVRLSQSKLGPLVCPNPITVAVRLRSFGPEPLWLRSHKSDISVLNEQLLSHIYDAVLPHTDGARTIVDLGANTGIVARWLLARHPKARIVCVEPAAENVALLEWNLAEHGHRSAIVARCVGGSRRPVMVGTTNGAWAYAMTDADGAEANSSVVTMDDVIVEHGLDKIDLLKCDTEGAEWETFERCDGWIDRVHAMVVELHGGRLPRMLESIGTGWNVLTTDHDPRRKQETVTLARAA